MSLDTVNLRLTKDDAPDTDFLSETPRYLANIIEHIYSDGNTVLTGDLSGYKVRVSAAAVSVRDCSLCKWYLGDNFKEMTRGDTQKAVIKLSDLLHLPIDRAAVTRLDFALNIIVKHPITVYFEHLGTLNHYTRLLMQTYSLYYRQNTEQFVLYDKVREQKKAGAVIPELFQNRNVLRIEQRYLHRVSNRLKTAVTGAMLYNEAFYNMLLNRWRDTYNAIVKVNDYELNCNGMKTKKDLYKIGVLSLIERFGGQVNFLAQITDLQIRGELTKQQAYELKTAVKDAMKAKEGLTVESEVITELNDKVKRAVKFYR